MLSTPRFTKWFTHHHPQLILNSVKTCTCFFQSFRKPTKKKLRNAFSYIINRLNFGTNLAEIACGAQYYCSWKLRWAMKRYDRGWVCFFFFCWYFWWRHILVWFITCLQARIVDNGQHVIVVVLVGVGVAVKANASTPLFIEFHTVKMPNRTVNFSF